MRTRTFTFEMLSLLVATAAATACGGKAADSDDSTDSANVPPQGGQTNDGTTTGSTSGSGRVGSDCGPLRTTTTPVDMGRCEPQVESKTTYDPGSTCGAKTCSAVIVLPCSPDAGVPDGGGEEDAGDVGARGAKLCEWAGLGSAAHFVNGDGEGGLRVTCGGCGVGRPPSGFVAQDVAAPTEEGAWLARMAQLEAASVEAFDALHDDLALHGAPESLLRLVRIASEDEVRHARLAREQAERRGAAVPEVDVHVARGRSLVELAIENAREGCVEETFGAVVARIQAERAVDPELRSMLEGIARDELGHAFLSLRIAEWLDARIAGDARERVRTARAEKLAELQTLVPPEARAALTAIAPALA